MAEAGAAAAAATTTDAAAEAGDGAAAATTGSPLDLGMVFLGSEVAETTDSDSKDQLTWNSDDSSEQLGETGHVVSSADAGCSRYQAIVFSSPAEKPYFSSQPRDSRILLSFSR
jgi:hypothetical protein